MISPKLRIDAYYDIQSALVEALEKLAFKMGCLDRVKLSKF